MRIFFNEPSLNTGDSTAGGGLDKIAVIAEIRQTLTEVRDLPTLPTIVMEVMKLVSNPNSSVSEIVELLEEDLALTGKLLRTANSAYYGVPRKIDNLKMALVIIGMDEVSNLITSSSVLKMFPSRPDSEGFDSAAFWRHSAATAEITQGLYAGLRLPKNSGAYVAGLLHDIGKLVLNQYFHHYYLQCTDYALEYSVTPARAEAEVIGVDHGHIGGWLAQRWNLPDEIINAIAQHHIRPADTPQYSFPEMLDWADRFYSLLNGRTPDRVIAMLMKNQEFLDWIGTRSIPLPNLVNDLFNRMERSLKLQEILK